MRKVILILIIAVFALAIAVTSSLSYYDSRSREALVGTAMRELRPHATVKEMAAFMEKYTVRSYLDRKYHHEYGGFIPQTRLDRLLLNRKLQIVLRVDDHDTFIGADARVFYTGL
ncbi:MAG TPA: hypothetical protein VIY90_22130 [Steroidobacteraceae bacterium]